MRDSSMTDTDQLMALVGRKQACLVQLRDLGARQQELIESGDMTQLLRALASKHHLIGALQRIEHELAPFRDDDPDARAWRSSEARARCAEMAAQCRGLLDGVVRQEKLNETLMQRQRETVADRLNQVHAAARATGAYRMHARGQIRTAAAKGIPAESVESGGDIPASGLDLSCDIR